MTAHSVLTAPLADHVVIGGRAVPLRTDYRVWILLSTALADERLPAVSKMRLCLSTCYADLPDTVDRGEAYLHALRFYNRLPDTDGAEDTGNAPVRPTPREPILDFDIDGDRIYAAFYSAYGIDLTTAHLHWWQFLALLVSLPRDCAFMQTVSLRCMDPCEVQNDDARRRLRRAKAQVRIRRDKRDKEVRACRTDP